MVIYYLGYHCGKEPLDNNHFVQAETNAEAPVLTNYDDVLTFALNQFALFGRKNWYVWSFNDLENCWEAREFTDELPTKIGTEIVNFAFSSGYHFYYFQY